MCLLSPREVGPGAEASPRARRGHSRHTASDLCHAGSCLFLPRASLGCLCQKGRSPTTHWAAAAGGPARPGHGVWSRVRTAVGAHDRQRPDRAPPGPRRSSGHLLVCGNLLRGTEQLVVTLGDLLNLPEPERLGL